MNDWIETIAREEIVRLQPYVSARDVCKNADVFLDANENPYGKNQLNRYPDPDQFELRRAIASYVGNGITWKNVMAGNGSDEMIDLAIRVFTGKGDKIVCASPDYPMYKVLAAINGAKAREVSLDADFQLDADAILQSSDSRTKMIFLSSPNSPTGKEQPIAEIERLARKIRAVVFVDEAYFEFSGKSAARLVKKLPNLIVSRTFSKAWGLAGIRVGYLIAPEKIIELIRKVKPPYNVSRISAEMAIQALRGGKKRMRAIVKKLVKERERLATKLETFGFEVFPSSTNFLLCRCPPWKNASELQRELAARGIVVRDFSQKPKLKNCLRITIGKPNETRRLLSELQKVCKPDFDAIFFDMDGTLVDVSRSYLEAIRLTAEKISGRKVPESLVEDVKALPAMNNDWDATVEVLRRMGVKSSRREVVLIFQELFLGNDGNGLIANEKPLVDGKRLERTGKKIGIVTGRPRAEAKIAIRLLSLPERALLVAMEDTAKGKPDPAPLLLAKKICGAKCPVYVGDSASDRQAAAKAGIAFVAIGTGKKQEGEFARFKNVNAALRRLSP